MNHTDTFPAAQSGETFAGETSVALVDRHVRAAVAALPTLKPGQTFSDEFVAARVRAAVDGVHAEFKVKREEFEARLFGGPKSEIAKLHSLVTELRAKLKETEQRDAAFIGVIPVSGEVLSGRGETPGSPAAILAHYRSLAGKARTEFFAKNEDAIWAQVEKQF